MEKENLKNDREITFTTCGQKITMDNNYCPVFGRGIASQEALNEICTRCKKKEFRRIYRKKPQRKPKKIKITKKYIEMAQKLNLDCSGLNIDEV